MAKAGGKLITPLLTLVVLVGICLLLYPSVSEWWNSSRQTRAVASYGSLVGDISDGRRNVLFEEALDYNGKLAKTGNSWTLSDKEREVYESMLSVDETGIMGYVDIPKIRCTLPVYHGTSDDVLQVALGHIEGSSLPVGGESSHCVISGHRGLPSARLFTDLDQLEVGDVFALKTLDETLYYRVDKVSIVFPHELEDVAIEKGKDLCTLVTCTPYGVNTHRLLVRGYRIDAPDEEAASVVSDAILLDKNMVAFFLAAPVIVVLFLVSMLRGSPRKR